ncbi:MAG: IPT/TIG domain-containing protein, partial [Myxococcota bacterium]
FGEVTARSVQVVSDGVMRVVTPVLEPGTMDVTVQNPNGTAVCSSCFTFEEDDEPADPEFEVRIDEISPSKGPADGGTRIRIEGKGFLLGFAEVGEDVRDRTAVLFGDNTAVDFDVIDDRLIDVVTPPGNGGERSVRVQNPNGEALCEGCFRYFVPLSAGAITPNASPLEGGVAITLTGTGFTDDTVVLVGGRSAIAPQAADGRTITFYAPPAATPGAVDVTVLGDNGRDTLRRGLLYYAEPRLAEVDPPFGSHAGGTIVRLKGEGLAGASSVSFGGAVADDLQSSGGDLLVTAPPGSAGSAVDVEVVHPRGTTRMSSAFAYVDEALRDTSLVLVTPSRGSVEGGNTAILVGTGLDHADPQVRFGSTDASDIQPVDENRLSVLVPPAAEAGAVDVQIRNERGGARLESAYAYRQAMQVQGVSPAEGPSSGGTEVIVTGEGFSPEVGVRIGALPATSVQVDDENTITAVTPAGSAGSADVVVWAGEGEDRREGLLSGGFTYTEPLSLAQVDPARGSQAGGTYVLLWGAGFTGEAEVSFGEAPAEVVETIGQSAMAVRTPPGTLGFVDVVVRRAEEESVAPAAFQYYDPSNIRGGASGGRMAGTINVTALDNYSRAPVADAHVILGTDPDTPFQGQTDLRGQITFSDPSLVKAVSVTASRPGYEAVTISRIDTRDLTIYMSPNEGDAANLPPPAPAAFINPRSGNGTVCGFKLPQDRVLESNQREEARVWSTARQVTGLPPFGSLPPPFKVLEDCGEFGMASRPGNVAVYAKYGIVTQDVDPISGQVVESFEPLLMGITRGVEVPTITPPTCTVNRACPTGYTCSGEEDLDPEDPGSFRWCLCDSDEACGDGMICNSSGGCQEPVSADIVLDMHLDQEVPVRLLDPPVPPDGSSRTDATYAYLELGGEGALFVNEYVNTEEEDELLLDGFPRLPGDGFVFLNMSTAGGAYPISICYRRR